MLLNEMEIFYHIAVQQSFSKAAERLGVSKSFVSKSLSKLEQDLGVRLITRTTRKLVLTEAGETFYRACADVVHEGEKGYFMIRELQGKPTGRLKLSIPPALALNLVWPVLPTFLKQYPDVKLDVKLESRLVDLVKEGYDLALRSAVLESSNLIAQKIATVNQVICATATYLNYRGTPNIPADLTQHNCALYSGSGSALK